MTGPSTMRHHDELHERIRDLEIDVAEEHLLAEQATRRARTLEARLAEAVKVMEIAEADRDSYIQRLAKADALINRALDLLDDPDDNEGWPRDAKLYLSRSRSSEVR